MGAKFVSAKRWSGFHCLCRSALGVFFFLGFPIIAQGNGPPFRTTRFELSGLHTVSCQAGCSIDSPDGTSSYEVSKGKLRRYSDTKRLYNKRIAYRGEDLLLVSISTQGNLIAAAIERHILSGGGFSAFGPAGATGRINPNDMQYAYRVELINPKSGIKIKTVSLGPFEPTNVGLSKDGSFLMVVGEDLQSGRKSVRCYNTHSGQLSATEGFLDGQVVALGGTGFRVASQYWSLIQPKDVGGAMTSYSSNPYSIAEYDVSCSDTIIVKEFEGLHVAVVDVSSSENQNSNDLGSLLSLKLREKGLAVVERQRMKEVLEELQLATSGLTMEGHAVEIGKLGGADRLVFGNTRVSASTTDLVVRMVSVETGQLDSACRLRCRDCRKEDLGEGVEKLVDAWVQPMAGD